MGVKALFKSILFNILIIVHYDLVLPFKFIGNFDIFGEKFFWKRHMKDVFYFSFFYIQLTIHL